MQEIVGDKLLPPLIESEVYKKAINYGRLPSELGEANADLEYPFEVFLERLRRFLPQIPGRTFHQEKVAV
jgi:hypothetical protein